MLPSGAESSVSVAASPRPPRTQGKEIIDFFFLTTDSSLSCNSLLADRCVPATSRAAAEWLDLLVYGTGRLSLRCEISGLLFSSHTMKYVFPQNKT